MPDAIAALRPAANSNIAQEIFNVGSGGTYSINYLAKLLNQEHNKVYIPKRPGEPDCTYADITKIKKVLGWEPKVSFEEGVKIMLEHIEEFKDAPVWDEKSIEKVTKDWFKYLDK